MTVNISSTVKRPGEKQKNNFSEGISAGPDHGLRM